MISYLGSLVQFSPAAGRSGRCGQCVWGALAVFWPGSQKFWRPLPGCSAPFPSVASGPGSQGLVRPLPWERCTFSLRGERPGQPEVWRPLQGRGAPFPSAASSPGRQRFGALSTGAVRLFPPRPQRAPPVGSQEVFRQEPGACLPGGRGWLLWG